MGKTLVHLCIQCLAQEMVNIPHLGKRLAPSHKELLLEHCANHDLLVGSRLPHITYNLISPTITHLNLYRSEQVTDQFLQLFAQCGCRLTALTIHACANVTDAGVLSITKGQDQLITLELRKLSNMFGHGLIHVRSPHLERVDLSNCTSLTSDGPETLVLNNPSSIKVLILAGCFKLTESIFSKISKSLIKLEELNVADVHCTNDDCVLMIADGCHNLRKLDIYGCNRVTSIALIKVFQNCTLLQDLDLSYCSRLHNGPEYDCLTHLPESISSLTLNGIQVESAKLILNSLSRLKCLTELNVCGVPAINDGSIAQILKTIGHQLVHLNLSGTIRTDEQLSDIGLEAITDYCTQLEVLLLSSPCGTYTGVALIPIFENPERCCLIRKISLSSRNVCKELINSISQNCHNLELFHVSGLHEVVTDETLHNLASNCRLLHTMYAKGCPQITDDGVCDLARQCPLKVISLSGNRLITDKSIFTIANSCPYMEEVYLNGCYYVSPAVVTYLRDTCIPRVFIYHKLPNASPGLMMAKNLDTGEFCRADLMLQ